MSKIHNILTVIEGSHAMGTDSLGEYHAARKVRDAGRIRDVQRRHSVIKTTLHPYRVMVSWSGIPGDGVRVYNPASGQKVLV